VLVRRSRHGLMPCGTSLRGVRLVDGVHAVERADRPLMPLASRSELLTRAHTASSAAEAARAPRPPMGSRALRRMKQEAATHAGFASPDYAASSRFLNALTLHSASDLSGLVSCRWRP
jgi:hypothetical protein